LLIDDQGAIAVWGPSGVSINEQATLLAREFLTELSSGSETRLGPMIDRALPVVADLEFGRDMIEMYNLLGDPALRVVKANESTGSGGSGGTPEAGGAGGLAGGIGAGSSDGGGGCAVSSSERGASGSWLLLLGALAALVRKRNAKRSGRR